MVTHQKSNGDHPGHHIVPFRTLIVVFASLIGLTALTYATARFLDAGALNVPISIAIACVKAFLVVMFFMALKYDARVNALIFSIGGLFVIVFIAFTSLDVFFRDMVDEVEGGMIWDKEVVEAELMARDSLIAPLLESQPVAPGIATDTTTAD